MKRRQQRPAPPRPWTPEEDAELANMVGCGLDCSYYKLGLPDRTFGEILDRRLTLKPYRPPIL